MFGPYLDALLRITTAFLKHPRLFHAYFRILSGKLSHEKINIKPNSITAFLKHPRLFHAHFLSGKLSHRLPVIPRKYRHPRRLTNWILQNYSLFTNCRMSLKMQISQAVRKSNGKKHRITEMIPEKKKRLSVKGEVEHKSFPEKHHSMKPSKAQSNTIKP